MDNTKELITAIEKVRSYCHNQDNCLHCIFYDIDLLTAAIFRVFLMNGFITGFRKMKFSYQRC